MLKIGEFARLSQVSIKTLRHYDALGLLRPSQVDEENGYRQYETQQLVDMMRIQALKDCGCTLEEIAHLLRTSDVVSIRDLLQQRLAIQQQLVMDEQSRLQRLLARVEQLDGAASTEHYDVVLKRTEPLTLVGSRGYVETTQEIGPFANTVVQQLEKQALMLGGPLIHLYFEASEESIELFVGTSVSALPAMLSRLTCERLAGGEQVACILYRGDYPDIGAAYSALDRWLSTTSYRLNGPAREIYHHSLLHSSDSTSFLTEIQYPICIP